MDHDITSIQDFISPAILAKYDAVDINVYGANLFHTKLLIRELDLENYLFNTDPYEFSPRSAWRSPLVCAGDDGDLQRLQRLLEGVDGLDLWFTEQLSDHVRLSCGSPAIYTVERALSKGSMCLIRWNSGGFF